GLQGRPLDPAQRGQLNQRISNLQGRGNLTANQQARLNSFRSLRAQDRNFNHINQVHNHFNSWFGGWGGGWWGIRPWWFGLGWGLGFWDFWGWGSPGWFYPGIYPWYPAWSVPVGDLGCVMQVVPEYDAGTDEGPPPSATTRSYQTRFLRLGNGMEEAVTFHVRYHSPSDEGKWAWFPPEKKVLDFTVEPGKVIDVYDGDWRVNADRARIWAESASGKKWDTFEQDDLLLVPE